MQGGLACWTSLRTTGVHLVPSKINTIMICCSRIIAGIPGLAQAEIKTCCRSSSLVQPKQLMAGFFSARPLQNKQCVKSSQKGLPWGKLQESTPSSISFIAFFFKKVCITYLFSQWAQGSFMNTESWVVLIGYAKHSCKLVPMTMPILP